MRNHAAAIAAVILSATTIAGACFAEAYPSKPIRLIVPSGPGSAPDIRGRWLAEKLRISLGQPVIVDNKPGASSIIGTLAATQSRPDGYTLLLSHQGIMALNPHLYPDLPYNPFKDLAPVSRLVVSPMILVVHPDSPAHSVADLVRLAKEKPGQFNVGSPGVGSPPHMAAELFKRAAHIDVTNVPYKSASDHADRHARRSPDLHVRQHRRRAGPGTRRRTSSAGSHQHEAPRVIARRPDHRRNASRLRVPGMDGYLRTRRHAEGDRDAAQPGDEPDPEHPGSP